MDKFELAAKSWAYGWGEPIYLGRVLAGRCNDREIKQQFEAIHLGYADWPGWS